MEGEGEMARQEGEKEEEREEEAMSSVSLPQLWT